MALLSPYSVEGAPPLVQGRRQMTLAWQIRGLQVPLVTVTHIRLGGDPGRANDT